MKKRTLFLISDSASGLPSAPSAVPPLDEIKKDLATVNALVEKYSARASILPGVLGSALGGLRTALRGLQGHAANEAAKPAPGTAPGGADGAK